MAITPSKKSDAHQAQSSPRKSASYPPCILNANHISLSQSRILSRRLHRLHNQRNPNRNPRNFTYSTTPRRIYAKTRHAMSKPRSANLIQDRGREASIILRRGGRRRYESGECSCGHFLVDGTSLSVADGCKDEVVTSVEKMSDGGELGVFESVSTAGDVDMDVKGEGSDRNRRSLAPTPDSVRGNSGAENEIHVDGNSFNFPPGLPMSIQKHQQHRKQLDRGDPVSLPLRLSTPAWKRQE
ncbi:hypothetical protein OCU04_007160 [Sclerotinia nivalis]|uniref:Uncharacterized protein n=1 Tax=Sclerotinia nivalis TaxID=352851 RepID=A0A9X0AL89_9HELO|nr:hypothetical protein OCU04_007160 [Sclerotinia nivalis]